MVHPSSNSSRLSALKNARLNASKSKQSGITDFLKKSHPIVPVQYQHYRTTRPSSQSQKPVQAQTQSSQQQQPQAQRQKSPILSETQNTSTSTQSNKILNGVVACLDVRTEDGDDVSQNFERALQSMGAKNGSPATLKKAMSKNVFIINLLWISRCKREGKRLPEKDFLIEQPQGLVIAGKKRRKSMEPGKVRALVLNELEPSSTSSWTARDFNKSMAAESLNRKRHIEEAEAYDDQEDTDVLPPRLSLPISVESIASRHISKKQKMPVTIPVHVPSLEMKEQIKARFSIGQAPTSKPAAKSSSNSTGDSSNFSNLKIDDTLRQIDPSQLSISSPTQVGLTPIKRKRRLTGSLNRPSISSSIDALDTPNVETNNKPQTIVLTSVTPSARKKYEAIIKKLGKFHLATEVTETTSHVLVGAQRRTKSLTLGFLRGAWILNPEWLIQSGNKGEYLAEDKFELVDWYPRAKAARERQRLLPESTRINIQSSSSGVDFIKELIKLAGGTVVENSQDAHIIICDKTKMSNDKRMVTDHWLFESIEHWKFMPLDNYGHEKK
ncbi:hypothetical protein [Parasitella parasitica]|uniref:BRCT domain-containing protein n=1 Tax=Parasitella parasitica TaxID=35722 RepID=A0A0B7NNR8_9FUNG|nr:hypothetical protein [Parasitella parasitica]